MGHPYYDDKAATLKDVFGAREIHLEPDALTVDGRRYPIIDDVIVLLDPSQYSSRVKESLAAATAGRRTDKAEDIQYTFGEEWTRYRRILPEHRAEFDRYFDIVDLGALTNARVCDLGCGIGRWSSFLQDKCREILLIDFSDAIFTARKNISSRKALFFMADLRGLPLRDGFCDFLFSLGVLHHLPVPCLTEVRRLSRMSPRLLIFLYYALDNRPFYFRILLGFVTAARAGLSRVRLAAVRKAVSVAGAVFIYKPLVVVGGLLRPLGLADRVPLYEFYHDKSLKRIEQDVYDRFFTRIEQRVTRKEIMSLKDTFRDVTISPDIPYWHFLCTK